METRNRTRVEADLDSLAEFARRALEATRDFRRGEVYIELVGDRRIQALNTQWRGKDRPTDVLSFPMDGADAGPGPILLGDIIIGARQAAADAAEEGVTLAEKLRELVLHSLLHLMGYTHETPADARRMEHRRRQILDRIKETVASSE
ncbi:rRNA maturation RNase YbeY [bacterium]